MAAAWAVLAVAGGVLGFTVALPWGLASAVVAAFVGAWTLTGVMVAAMLLRNTSPTEADGADLDLNGMTDQMVGALRGALDAADRRGGAVEAETPSRAAA